MCVRVAAIHRVWHSLSPLFLSRSRSRPLSLADAFVLSFAFTFSLSLARDLSLSFSHSIALSLSLLALSLALSLFCSRFRSLSLSLSLSHSLSLFSLTLSHSHTISLAKLYCCSYSPLASSPLFYNLSPLSISLSIARAIPPSLSPIHSPSRTRVLPAALKSPTTAQRKLGAQLTTRTQCATSVFAT